MKILEYFKNQKEDKNFNLLPDGIFTIEQDGKIISVNNKILEIFNTSRFNILGRYFSDFIEDGNTVLNKITNEQVKVMFEGVRPFADQILKCIEKDNNCIFKLDNKTFCHEELIETIVVRYLSIKFAKFESVEEENITDEMRDEYDKLVELHDKMMEIVEKYRVIN